MITERFWRAHYNAGANTIGATVRLDDQPYTVIGVIPAWFRFPSDEIDVFIPFERAYYAQRVHWRFSYYLAVLARLRPGVTVEQARQDADAIVTSIHRRFPDDLGRGAVVIPMQEEIVADVRTALFILLGAVGFVLLIACANIANLNLAQTASRQREIAIRVALGASRHRVVLQLLTESFLLAFAGGALGLALARLGVRVLLQLAPDELPRLQEIHIDFWVLGFTLLASLIAAMIFGLLPALTSSQFDPQEDLKETGRSASGGERSRRFRGALVVSEIALALMLLTGAGLMIESFRRVTSVNTGFNPDGLWTMRIALSETAYDGTQRQTRFFNSVIQRVRSLPGIHSFGLIDGPPFSPGGFDNAFEIDGEPLPSGQHLVADIRRADPGYIRAMGIPLLRGRWFTDSDRGDSHDIAVISESMARHYWPSQNPIGRHLTIEFGNPKVKPEIVGVVADVRNAFDAAPGEYIYIPYSQGRHVTDMYLVIRPDSNGRVNLVNMAKMVRGAVASLDRNQPVYRIRTMREVLAASVAACRFQMFLMTLFGALAICLASVGLYGVIAYSVQNRTREIGIRTALGAQSSQVMGLILKDGVRLTFLGIAIGLLGAFTLTRLLSGALYQVKPTDPPTLFVVSLLVLLVGLIASFLPANRAASVDPLVALRHE